MFLWNRKSMDFNFTRNSENISQSTMTIHSESKIRGEVLRRPDIGSRYSENTCEIAMRRRYFAAAPRCRENQCQRESSRKTDEKTNVSVRAAVRQALEPAERLSNKRNAHDMPECENSGRMPLPIENCGSSSKAHFASYAISIPLTSKRRAQSRVSARASCCPST